MNTPVSIYVIHHPKCKVAEELAKSLYDWFRLGYLSGDQSGAGLPVYYRRLMVDKVLQPEIRFDQAALNVVIVLVDEHLVLEPDWRSATIDLAKIVMDKHEEFSKAKTLAAKANLSQAMLLPVALHECFYRTGPLYQGFNPIRLLGLDMPLKKTVLRRAVTEAAARLLRGAGAVDPPPLNVFLSHAKLDGREIAEAIRDGVRNFGQLVAWYDSNDLPYGASWEKPMKRAAAEDTAAMIATVTDAYPTRPWCRQEANLARSPELLKNRGSNVWKVQPVVAVHEPGSNFVRGAAALDGVPRIGWDKDQPRETTKCIVDRLVLQVMLGQVHRQVAVNLENHDRQYRNMLWRKSCYITWVPDLWTLSNVRSKLNGKSSVVERIVYPGYGLSASEKGDLESAVKSFRKDTKLVSFEGAMV